mmetsp:Transcript_34964/g.88064  ORF Transcript_34964/g.88064 Transcript_34964/m.88064 type:complete len:306 (+) Transcript_34964:122-1039(+)
MAVRAVRDKTDDAKRAADDEDDDPIFDQNPVKVSCPHCGKNIITFIEHEASWVTYAVCLAMLFVLNWAALCVVPVVYPLFKDVVHHCPRCLSVLATRSRVELPSPKQEVMSFRFGSCVIVLARKYVIMLAAVMAVIGGIHWVRSSGSSAASGAEHWHRGPSVEKTWEDFTRDCGYKSYLGNPIHVSVAFKENYKNKTIHWEGTVHHVEDSLSFLWFSQRGAVFIRMQPPQFPSKRDMADLVLLYNDGDEVARAAGKLPRGKRISFEATFIDVGKRGAPHVLGLWEVQPLTEASSLLSGAAAAIGG